MHEDSVQVCLQFEVSVLVYRLHDANTIANTCSYWTHRKHNSRHLQLLNSCKTFSVCSHLFYNNTKESNSRQKQDTIVVLKSTCPPPWKIELMQLRSFMTHIVALRSTCSYKTTGSEALPQALVIITLIIVLRSMCPLPLNAHIVASVLLRRASSSPLLFNRSQRLAAHSCGKTTTVYVIAQC